MAIDRRTLSVTMNVGYDDEKSKDLYKKKSLGLIKENANADDVLAVTTAIEGLIRNDYAVEKRQIADSIKLGY